MTKLTSQFVKGISTFFQKLLRYFKGIVISTFVVVSPAAITLKDSEFAVV